MIQDRLTVDDLRYSILPEITNQIRVRGLLVLLIHTRQALNLAVPRALVQPAPVDLLTPLERRRHVHQEEVASLARNLLAHGLARAGVRRGRGGNDGSAGLGEFRSDKPDPEEIDVLLFGSGVDLDLGREVVPELFAEEEGDGPLALLLQSDLESAGDGVFTRVVEAGKEDGEALLGTRRVGFAQDLDDASVGEPVGDGLVVSTAIRFSTSTDSQHQS